MIIDLSVPLTNKTPVYPGDPAISIKPAGVVERDGYADHLLSLPTHAGTHIDAPAHMITGGQTLNQFPLEHFNGRGVVIKINGQYNIDQVKSADITAGDIILFNTGFDKQYHDTNYFSEYPTLPEDIAKYLIDQQVSMVGFDCASPDYEPFVIHKLLLGAGILLIENLTNLDKLKGEFEVIALPLNLQIDGSPARVIARTKPWPA
jgi:kynurenine formamidase